MAESRDCTSHVYLDVAHMLGLEAWQLHGHMWCSRVCAYVGCRDRAWAHVVRSRVFLGVARMFSWHSCYLRSCSALRRPGSSV